jgi:hypothetical protein
MGARKSPSRNALPGLLWSSRRTLLLDRVDAVQDRDRVDFLRVRLLDGLGELQELGAVSERERLQLARLLERGDLAGILAGLEVAAELARFLAGLARSRLADRAAGACTSCPRTRSVGP